MLNKLQFQNLAELQLQNLDQPLCSKSEKSLVLGPNVSSQICNKLLPTWSSLSTSATVTTSTSFELASSHARVTSIKFTKQEWVSESVREWVSEWQAFPMIGLGSDKKFERNPFYTCSKKLWYTIKDTVIYTKPCRKCIFYRTRVRSLAMLVTHWLTN